MGKVHDFTKRIGKHDYIFCPILCGIEGRMFVWNNEPIHVGDFLLLQNAGNSVPSRYRVTSVIPLLDDIFYCEVKWAPKEVKSKVVCIP